MKRTKTFLVGLCVGLMVLGMAASASADLIIDPTATTWTLNTDFWFGSEPKNPDAGGIADIVGLGPSSLATLYKDDTASTPYFNSYASNAIGSSGGEIVWNNVPYPNIVAAPVYFLVKDGDGPPRWYLFDISGWDGMEKIVLQNFWNGVALPYDGYEKYNQSGSISHDGFYGTPVPEPTSLLLLGFGLVGLAGARRMLRK